MSLGAVACTAEQSMLGEGARWDDRRDELLWVDVLAGRVHRQRVAEDGSLVLVARYDVPGTVGAIAPIEGDDGWLLATNRGFALLGLDGDLHPVAQVAPEGTRMNDAACDPQGRCWAGSLADDHRPGGGALHRLDRRGRAETVLEGLTIPNGMGWNADGTTMYLIDSGPRAVYAFRFDAESGTIDDRRVLVTVPEDVGAPDGMTIDAAGDLWVAIYGGGRVQRYSPDGVLLEELDVPAVQTTCCAFAGTGLSRLFVTTATENWTDEERRADPAAGLVYRLGTTATGLPAAAYVPDGAWWRSVTEATMEELR